MKVNAIVLAAGYGTRLSPLTKELPKPALPLAGVPMLARILRNLRKAGAERIAVNSHHLPEKIAECVEASGCGGSVRLFYEKEILGTAGPIVNAKELLSNGDYFILHNSDIACDFDLDAMLKQHVESGATVTMAAIDGPENRLHVLPDGRVADILDRLKVPYSEQSRRKTYAGIAVYSAGFFRYLPEKPCYSSLVDAWLSAIRAGEPIRIFAPAEPYFWNDVGSFQQYFEANRLLMHDDPIRIGRECRIAEDASLTGFVSVGDGAEVPSGAALFNCIVLPRAKVAPGWHAWEVITPTRTVHRDIKQIASLKVMLDEPDGWEPHSLPEQGSDRKFIRIVYPDRSTKVLMISNERDKDFDRFTGLGQCFNRNRLFTPELYAVCREEYSVLMEDLGDRTIYRMAAGKETENFGLYRNIIHTLAEFQVRGTSALDEDNQDIRVFSRRYLRWETEYFKDNFLHRLCGLTWKPQTEDALNREFDELAFATEKMPYLLIHRDFQSQNILCLNGGIRFVDYQGARLAPYSYDISSLVKDPYVRIPAAMREELFAEYRRALGENGYRIPEAEFRKHVVLTSLQRNMQALGAYGFLALCKRKLRYLDYAEPCLTLLLDSLEALKRMPEPPVAMSTLDELCNRTTTVLSERIKQGGGKI